MSLMDRLAELPALYENWQLERAISGYRYVKEVHCNWKIFWRTSPSAITVRVYIRSCVPLFPGTGAGSSGQVTILMRTTVNKTAIPCGRWLPVW